MSECYIQASGVLEKLDTPVKWLGFDVHPFLRKACDLVTVHTGKVWASGDFLAMRAAEYHAAALYADANYGESETGRMMRERASILINILSPRYSGN